MDMSTTSSNIPRGLVSVSLLKSYFDERKDHLEMFVPLLLDAIRSFRPDDFSCQQMVDHVRSRLGLALPSGTMDALLSRVRNAGYLQRDGGRFFVRRDRLAGHDLAGVREQIEKQEWQLAEALRTFCQKRGLAAPDSNEEALAAIVRFVDRNQVTILLEDGNRFVQEPEDTLQDRLARTTARFILDECLGDPDLCGCLRMLLEGFVLQNALLLRDFGTLTKDFQALSVFFDTTFLFALRGVRGPAEEQAAKETVQLLQALKANLAVFSSTLKEMRRILWVYESNIGTSVGILRLRQREETRFFLKNKFTPAMVREMAVGLESWLLKQGVIAMEMPLHDPRYTLDEGRLTDYLKGPDQDAEAPRVINDVDCIGAVLTLRAGRHPRSLDSARAVLATTAGMMVRNSTRWFREQQEPGIPPVVHLAALTSIAWLKKPAAVADLKMHELIAMCGAALRPHRRTWDRFVGYLRSARAEGTLSTDEEVAVLASELVDGHLSELSDVSDDPDAATIAEVVERVKHAYGDRATKIEAEAEARVETAERARQDERRRADQEAVAIQESMQAAADRAASLEKELQATVDAVRRRARAWASTLSWLVYALASAAVIYATWQAGAMPDAEWKRLAWRLGGALVVVLGVAGTLWGTHLGELRLRIAEWLEKRLRDYLLRR